MQNFRKEIADMMRGFGDNPDPDPAAVIHIETIVYRQLRALLQEAYYVSEDRGQQLITNYEIIFLMRKNTAKLKQLKDYQESLDQLKKGIYSSIYEDELLQEMEDEAKPKLKRNHIAIIEELDERNEVKKMKTSPRSMERKFRAAIVGECVPVERFEDFHKARCSSFHTGTSNRSYDKLENWINADKDFKISYLAWEVIAFIAYETVAELVDGVFKLRQDANKKHRMRFRKLRPEYFLNPIESPPGIYMKTVYQGCAKITAAEVRQVMRNMNQDVPVRFVAF